VFSNVRRPLLPEVCRLAYRMDATLQCYSWDMLAATSTFRVAIELENEYSIRYRI